MIEIITFFCVLAVGVGLRLYGKHLAKDEDPAVAEPRGKLVNVGKFLLFAAFLAFTIKLIRHLVEYNLG